MFDEEATIKEVTENADHFFISTVDGWCFGFEKKYGVTPKSGDLVKTYTVNGSTVRGVDLNGVRVFYKSDEQLEQERKEWLASHEREKQDAFQKNRAKMDADYEALPQNFKKRLDRFRANNDRFRVDYEAYEMFCCKEAVKIAAACFAKRGMKKPHEKVQEFARLPWEEQMKMIPAIADGHSGNTFGCACRLAYIHLRWPKRIHEPHGALSPLVGSAEYGDMAKSS